MLDARELAVSSLEQQRHGRSVLNIGGVHLGPQHQPSSVNQNVALATVHALGAIVPAHAADAGGPDRLAVDDGGTWLGLTTDDDAQLVTENAVQALPRAIQTPQTEIVIGGLPWRKFVWEEPPRTATPNNVEDRVQDLANRVQAGSADALG